MDWGAIIQLSLAILGAASIAGGIFAYRGSTRTGIRAFGASALAAGVVMWAHRPLHRPGIQLWRWIARARGDEGRGGRELEDVESRPILGTQRRP